MLASLQNSLKKYAFGQLLSLILASTGLINGWMNERLALNIPAIQAALTYTLILIGSLSYHFFIANVKSNPSQTFRSLVTLMSKHKYIMLGAVLFDVTANWLVVKAFSELQLPEVMVFSGLSTPVAITLAWLWTRPRPIYTRMQIMGVFMALAAIVLYFFVSGIRSSGSVQGITCAVFSAIAYAASNNFQERVAQEMSAVEFLIGLGSIGSSVAWLITSGSWQEFRDLGSVLGNDLRAIGLIGLYACVLSSFYLLIPVYMSKHSAVSFNFSLLTANFFGIIASWLLLNSTYSNWLYLSVALINFGLLIYYVGEEPQIVQSAEIKSIQSNQLAESNISNKTSLDPC